MVADDLSDGGVSSNGTPSSTRRIHTVSDSDDSDVQIIHPETTARPVLARAPQRDAGDVTYRAILDHMVLTDQHHLRSVTDTGEYYNLFQPPSPFLVLGRMKDIHDTVFDLEQFKWRSNHVLALKDIITQDATWQRLCAQCALSGLRSAAGNGSYTRSKLFEVFSQDFICAGHVDGCPTRLTVGVTHVGSKVCLDQCQQLMTVG
jgi:hypothetical protein